MALSKEFVEELKFRNSIEEVIGSYVNLERVGRNVKCKCPFHNETDASLVVYQDTQSFYCFGCGAAGDVISFIRRIENLEYMDTIRLLADRVNMEVPKLETGYSDNRSQRDSNLLINKIAARFFYDNLIGENGKDALDYLRGRGLLNKTIVKFGIGYASDSWDQLKNHLLKNKFKEEDLVKAGIVGKSKNGRVYDQFRDRIIFPIINIRGDIIGFGGRLMKGEGPRYLNSPDSLVFKKSRNLFSMNFAKDNGKRQLILTEGYMDVIALNQAGFIGAVATLGTAITTEQAYLISSYADEVIVAYDSDIPGQKATRKAIDIFSKTPINIKIIDLGEEKDPDDYIKNHSKEEFSHLIDKSLPALDYLLDRAKKKYSLNTSSGQSMYLKEAVIILSGQIDMGVKDIYSGKVARELMIDKQTVFAQIRAVENQPKRRYNNTKQEAKLEKNEKEDTSPAIIKAEEDIIGALYNDPTLLKFISDRISEDDFVSNDKVKLFRTILMVYKKEKSLTFNTLRDFLDEKELSKLVYIINKNQVKMSDEAYILGCIDRIKMEKSKKTISDLEKINTEDLSQYIKNLSSEKKGNE